MAKVYKGREKVIIPISKKDFFQDVKYNLKEYLSYALQTHRKNVRDIKRLHEIYLGEQDIYKTKKRYNGSEINHIVVENHTKKVVDFKVGFMYGKPLDYSIAKSMDTDDLTYLNTYIKDSNKSSLDIEKAQDLYEFGVSYQLILPKTSSEIENIETQAPFKIDRLPLENTCVVWSNDIPSQQLFGLVVGTRLEKGVTKNVYNIYMQNQWYLLDHEFNVIQAEVQAYDYVPVIEYTINNCRMGLVELVLPLQNLINNIDSSQIDEIEENVNSWLVIKNQLIDEEWQNTFKELKKERLIALMTNNPDTPPSVDIINNELKQEAVNLFVERIQKALYDIASTPQASGNVTSGGDTGQARLLGNGWESSQNQAQVDETYLLQYEYQVLRAMLSICKKYEKCKVNKVNASEINIKFNINMSNNLLVKTQSLQNLRAIHFPPKEALTICGITNDVDGVGNAWESSIKEQQELSQVQLAQKTQTKDTNTNDK